MPSPGGQFLSDEFGDIEDYFVSDYTIIDQYIGDQLWTWGLGNGGANALNTDNTGKSTPVTTFAGGTNWKQVGGRAAIKTDGTLWVWGGNGGTLGTNDTTNRNTPVTTFAGGNDWKQVSENGNMAAIKTDGTLWVWGTNSNAQLGTNDNITRSTPVTTFAGGNDWKQVFVSTTAVAAVKTDGTLWVWGRNDGFRLGIYDGPSRVSTPVTTFAGGTNWKQVSISDTDAVRGGAAIKTDGTLWTWGTGFGSLGNNTTLFAVSSTPVTTFAGGTDWKQVALTKAIKTDGTLWTWGSRSGDNTNNSPLSPVTTFAGGTNWKQVAFNGGEYVAAIKTDGTLWVWGSGGEGKLGTNDTTNRSTPVTTFAGGSNWNQVNMHTANMVAIKSGLTVDLS